MKWSEASKGIMVEAVRSAGRNDITGRAAQLAYYFFLSLFPAMILVAASLGILAGEGPKLRDELLGGLGTVLPETSFALVRDSFTQIVKSSNNGGLFTFGALAALWSATAGVSAVQDALNSVYEVTEGRPYWKRSLIAILLTLSFLVLALAAGAATLLGAYLPHLLASTKLSAAASLTWHAAEWVVILFLLSMIFAVTYYLGPDVEQPKWRWITPGAGVGILTWIGASLAFRIYLHHFDSYTKTYGSIGAVMILLLWLYVSGLALLFGAEINSAAENQSAKQGNPDAKEKGEKVPG
ncbi:YihY/virulence factor BrkB family protein [Acidipila sp. EB88]|uniref:YihY/virulence factor BrkB family protein n=1 Tax=Acidipila sp. EB88 TaxID=2305226 RepID=UPI000F602FF5|nr:YihY/virulence factor BrkB family protein [Acidipila sp. EB88]RRA47466.1 YihY/virulence factor BrkB family protein [Acidipila sp. EB88]